MKSGVMIATVEHLLSALMGCGVDNAIIEIDSVEAPILDGSSGPWAKLIERAGVVQLSGPAGLLARAQTGRGQGKGSRQCRSSPPTNSASPA